jgi:hypothetical protein
MDGSHHIVERMLERVSPDREESMKDHRTSASAAESVGRWRRELDPRLVRASEEALGEILTEFGYTQAGGLEELR